MIYLKPNDAWHVIWALFCSPCWYYGGGGVLVLVAVGGAWGYHSWSICVVYLKLLIKHEEFSFILT
jgi:hypothetical protein